MDSSNKLIFFFAYTFISLVVTFALPHIQQPLSFHHFADSRSWLGIPNVCNVVTNIPFIVVGLYGIIMAICSSSHHLDRAIFLFLFTGVVLTGLGSAYYHWHPDNNTLVWDRIPMTIIFMSFLSATLTELVSRPLGILLLLPLVLVGVSSVIYWHYTEIVGRGDLRLYMWVQFYPMITIPLLMWLYYAPTVKAKIPSLIWIIVWYIIAKGCEQLDYPIYKIFSLSGHSIKHLAAAMSTWYFIKLFRKQSITSKSAIIAD